MNIVVICYLKGPLALSVAGASRVRSLKLLSHFGDNLHHLDEKRQLLWRFRIEGE